MMSSYGEDANEAKAAAPEKQRAIHLRQLLMIQILTCVGLIAFAMGCAAFRDAVRIAGNGALVFISIASVVGLGVIWRWFVFHSTRIRALDVRLSGMRFDEGEEMLASIPAPMTIYPLAVGFAQTVIAGAMFVLNKNAGFVAVMVLFCGVVVAALSCGLLVDADGKMRESNEAEANGLDSRGSAKAEDGEPGEASAS